MWHLINLNSAIFWCAIVLICVVPYLAHYWYKARKAELEASIKLEMLQRGMSADDIVRVLQAPIKHEAEDSPSRTAELPEMVQPKAQS
jgi:hypothetical protein